MAKATKSAQDALNTPTQPTQAFDNLDDWMTEGTMAPDVLKLEQGQRIRGILEGNGQIISMTDAAGDPKDIPTWRITTIAGDRYDLMSASNLDKNLPELVGHEVGIAFMGQSTTRKGMKVNDFKIVDFGNKAKS